MEFIQSGRTLKPIEQRKQGEWVFFMESKIQGIIRRKQTKKGLKTYPTFFVYLPKWLFQEKGWLKGDSVQIAVHEKKYYYLLIKNVSLQERLRQQGIIL